MRFTSEMIKKAWAIRKAAAVKFDCKVMDIHFGICIKMAKAESEEKMEIKGTKKWEKHGKVRQYFQKGYLAKAGAFYTEDAEETGKYEFPFGNGKIIAAKCYNGCVQDEIAAL